MSGISGFFAKGKLKVSDGGKKLAAMNFLQQHRGGANDLAVADDGHWGFACIFDGGSRIRRAANGDAVTFGGMLTNLAELRRELGASESAEPAELALQSYGKWGNECVCHMRGSFAFAVYSKADEKLVCFRDRLGIAPFYYTVADGVLYFASEIKALVPFLPSVEADHNALKQYLTFQYCLDDSTLFAGVKKLMPATRMECNARGELSFAKYWELEYNLDFDHSEKYFLDRTRAMIEEAVLANMPAGVDKLGVCLSGGLDSSIVGTIAAQRTASDLIAFTGKFTCYPGYDESRYAQLVAEKNHMDFRGIDITSKDFIDNISKVIYHLDEPAAGPGAFPQFCVGRYASQYRKFYFGGQGGDEIFGGYARYLVAYFEQCIKGAIEGTLDNGDFIVSYASIIPNLRTLQNYKPMIRSFWKDGVFDSLDARYFRLVNRAPELADEIRWDNLHADCDIRAMFDGIFNRSNAAPASYIDKMMHYDFNTSLPALLQVEDRMSMAHGMTGICPLLDHKLIEFMAAVPGNFKFKNGELKRMLKLTCGAMLPPEILGRKDKMGFPVPLSEWLKGDLRDFVGDLFVTQKNRQRSIFNSELILKSLNGEARFSRKVWGLLSLELWYQNFVDKAQEFRDLVK